VGVSPIGPVLAVDIGGTKVAAGMVDESGALSERHQIPTADDGREGEDGDALFARLAALVDDVRSAAPEPAIACGVGCGGPMTVGGATVSPLNIPAWRGFPLQARLEEHLGLPTSVDNDAKALALGEGWLGAARGVDDYLAMVVSTGVGGGIVLEGQLLDGATGNAGHIGHVIVVPNGRTCACGAQGCLEAEASGRNIEAATGRPAAEATVEVRRRTGMLVGRAVASVANLLDLQLAVVAGSVALGFGDDFFTAAQEEIDRSARPAHARGTVIRPGGLGDEGPLIGAAAVTFPRSEVVGA
jgi:glucokinase